MFEQRTTFEGAKTKVHQWKGLAGPISRLNGGYFKTSDILDLLWSSIIMILGTPRLTRIMEPEFGSGLYELLFNPNDSFTQQEAKSEIVSAIQKWEPRVVILDSTFEIDEHTMRISVKFAPKNDPAAVTTRGIVVDRGTSLRVLETY